MKRDSPMYGYWQIETEIETEIEIEESSLRRFSMLMGRVTSMGQLAASF